MFEREEDEMKEGREDGKRKKRKAVGLREAEAVQACTAILQANSTTDSIIFSRKSFDI